MNYCNIHQAQMEQRLSKTKFDDNGQPKPYFAHMFEGKMCFGRPDKSPSKAPSSQTPARDFDAENRGKVRNNIIEALIQHSGTEALKGIVESQQVRRLINEVTEFVMNGEDL